MSSHHIQIGDISPRIQYTGDGSQTAFTYPFPIFKDADIEVFEDTTLKTLTTDYTVSGVGNSSGGTVTFVTAPTNNVVVTLKRNITIARTSDFDESGAFRSKVINDELDTITAVQQQIQDSIDRSLRLTDTDTGSSPKLPVLADRLSKYLGFDSSGDPVALDAPANTTAVTVFMATVLLAATAAAARLLLVTPIAPTSTDNALARYTGTAGDLQNSGWMLDDSDVMNAADNVLQRPELKDYAESVNAIGSIGGGTQDIDLTLGNVVTGTVDTSTTTFTFSNPPASGKLGGFELFLTNGGSQTVNWPSSVDWPGGTAPTLTTSGVDRLIFETLDGGTIWHGVKVALDSK